MNAAEAAPLTAPPEYAVRQPDGAWQPPRRTFRRRTSFWQSHFCEKLLTVPVRVPTKEQNETRQLIAIREFGIEERYIVIDKQSGKDFDRPGYKKLVKKMKSADTLVIKSIDRLGRNYEDILLQWRILTQEKGVDVVVLDVPLLETRIGRDLTGTLIADIVLQLLSYVAQTEREFIRQRQAEGIAAAKAKGVRFGRCAIEKPVVWESVYAAWHRGEISGRTAAQQLGVSHTTFQNWVKMHDE